MKIIFLKYQVNQNHSFLTFNLQQYNKFINSYKIAEQSFENRYISESTKFIDYLIDNSTNIDKEPQIIGYIIVENENSLLNFIVTGWERVSNEVIRFNVIADVFRNDLNKDKNGISGMSYGYIEQTNGKIDSVEPSQLVLPNLGDAVKIESETYPLRNIDGTNWVVIICGETELYDYGVFATEYASDIGTMTHFARIISTAAQIKRVSDGKTTTFKATSCYIVPKGIIRDGYIIPELAYVPVGHEGASTQIYPINAFFKRTEITINDIDMLKIYDFGTIAKRVIFNKLYDTPISILSSFNSSDISIGIQYNDIYLDVTDEFAFPIATDEFAQYASLNKRDMAIKTTTAVGGVVVGGVLTASGIATGNIVQAGAGVASILTGVSKMASFADKNEQPYSVTSNNDGCANVTFNNGFSIRKYQGRNYEEASRTVEKFGYQYKRVLTHLNLLLSDTNRIIGTTFVKFKSIENSQNIRSETFARLLNGVFV